MSDQRKNRLTELLAQEPGRFDPVTAFRVAQSSGPAPGIRSHVGVAPAIHPVDQLRQTAAGATALRTTLASLNGPLGSLPPAYNETAMREARNRAHAFTAFIDIFNGRLSGLFVAACEKYRLARLLRWCGADENIFVKTLLSLSGFGTRHLVEQSGVPRNVLLSYSGFWSKRTRNADSLAALLGDISQLPVRVEQFCPQWLRISTGEQTRLGLSNAVLGADCKAGTHVQDYNSRFQIVIGPVGYHDYLSLAPDTARLKALMAIVRLYAGDGLVFDFRIVLRKEEIPFSCLSAAQPARLGWSGWARAGPATADCAEAVIASPVRTSPA
jgi:type VI secretion system protein ImpH